MMSNLEMVMLEKEDNKEGLIQSGYFLSEPDRGVGKDFSMWKSGSTSIVGAYCRLSEDKADFFALQFGLEY